MSVLIKGMKMPASCAGCYMFLHGLTMDERPWQECAVTERELDDPFGCGKPDWCPITEIKELHGRLIDADALDIYQRAEAAYAEYQEDEDNFYLEGMAMGLCEAAKQLSAARTIVQASEEEKCV